MAKKFVLFDDLDGKELPENTPAINLSLGRTTYALYLSDKNHEALLKALEPFITDAETVEASTGTGTGGNGRRTSGGSPASAADKERNKRVRAWAQSTGFKYTGADGEERTLGDRGQIPPAVMDAYAEANPDD